MANEIKNVKEAILTWTYNQLNSRYPNNFKISEYTSTITGKTKKAPNVYWINTIPDRPELATECYLDISVRVHFHLCLHCHLFSSSIKGDFAR